MQSLLLAMARITNTFSLLAGGSSTTNTQTTNNFMDSDAWKNVMKPICDLLSTMLTPILIIIGTAGSIYAIILGVNYSKAETADKREEAKKRLINAIIGMVIMIIMLVLLKLFTDYAEEIATWISGQGKTATPAAV